MVPAAKGSAGTFHAKLEQNRVGILLKHSIIIQDVARSRRIQASKRPEIFGEGFCPSFDFVIAGLGDVLGVRCVALVYFV